MNECAQSLASLRLGQRKDDPTLRQIKAMMTPLDPWGGLSPSMWSPVNMPMILSLCLFFTVLSCAWDGRDSS